MPTPDVSDPQQLLGENVAPFTANDIANKLTSTQGFLYALVDSYGCGGPSDAAWVLFDRPVSVGELDGIYKSVSLTLKEATQAASDSYQLMTVPKLKTWTATMGEFFKAENQALAYNSEVSQARSCEIEREILKAWGQAGGQMVDFPRAPIYQGVEYDERDDFLPLCRIQEHYCRCGHGGLRPADWVTEKSTSPASTIVPVTANWTAVTFTHTPSSGELAGIVSHAEEAFAQEVACALDAHERRVWAASVTREEIDAMDVSTYQAYKRLLPMGVGSQHWENARSTTPRLSGDLVGEKAQEAFFSHLQSAGLYFFTTNQTELS